MLEVTYIKEEQLTYDTLDFQSRRVVDMIVDLAEEEINNNQQQIILQNHE